jgi:DNA-binding response OmpR family regulator
MKQKVLIVEDESIVAMEIASYVTALGYEVVTTVSNAEDAYREALEEEPDVILMDVNLKGAEDGISAAQRIKAEKEIAIVYITAFNDDKSIDRAVATNPAAYLTKPFNRKELAASLKIAAQNTQRNSAQVEIKIDHEFSYDQHNRQLLRGGEFVHLTKKEQELLSLLLDSRMQLVDIYTLENRIWPDKFPNENTRRGLVARLRTKLNHPYRDKGTGLLFRDAA